MIKTRIYKIVYCIYFSKKHNYVPDNDRRLKTSIGIINRAVKRKLKY